MENTVLDCFWFIYPFHQIPLKFSPVYIPGVRCLFGIVLIGVVIDLSHLVPAVKHRDARLKQHERVEHGIQPDSLLHGLPVMAESCFFHTAHGGGGSAEPGVARGRVVIVQDAPAETLRYPSCKEIIQKFLMGNLPHPPPFQKRIIQSPAYIIVTPQIIEEGTGRGQGTDRLHLAF